MELWNSKEIKEITNGKGEVNFSSVGVSIDTRTINNGDLFIALKGENFDGNKFVEDAIKKGASGAIVDAEYNDFKKKSLPVVHVKNASEALNNLGKAARKRTSAKIIAVTGSVGKTGTKEAIKIALSEVAETYATVGNLNNHFGAPLSLARMPKSTKFGIFELGMNHAGEISHLTKMVQPHTSIITTVEPVHLEFFNSVSDIANAKAEIFDSMGINDSAVINKDSPFYEQIRNKALGKKIKNIISFGFSKEAMFQVEGFNNTENGIKINLNANGKKLSFEMIVKGRHWALNSAGVLAVASSFGVDLEKAVLGLTKYKPTKGRGEVSIIKLAKGSMALIDDTYNASPASMSAAFEVLAARRNIQGRTIAVIGDMLELGGEGLNLHKGLREPLEMNNIDKVFACGQLMKGLYDTLPNSMKADYALNSEQLTPLVIKNLKENDVVLVKGSNGSKMNKVVEAIKSLTEK